MFLILLLSLLQFTTDADADGSESKAFVCPEKGSYAVQGDCLSFLVCVVAGSPPIAQLHCPISIHQTYFDPVEQVCSPYIQVCDLCKQDGNNRDPGPNQSASFSYISCKDGQGIRLLCNSPNDTFDPVSLKCGGGIRTEAERRKHKPLTILDDYTKIWPHPVEPDRESYRYTLQGKTYTAFKKPYVWKFYPKRTTTTTTKTTTTPKPTTSKPAPSSSLETTVDPGTTPLASAPHGRSIQANTNTNTHPTTATTTAATTTTTEVMTEAPTTTPKPTTTTATTTSTPRPTPKSTTTKTTTTTTPTTSSPTPRPTTTKPSTSTTKATTTTTTARTTTRATSTTRPTPRTSTSKPKTTKLPVSSSKATPLPYPFMGTFEDENLPPFQFQSPFLFPYPFMSTALRPVGAEVHSHADPGREPNNWRSGFDYDYEGRPKPVANHGAGGWYRSAAYAYAKGGGDEHDAYDRAGVGVGYPRGYGHGYGMPYWARDYYAPAPGRSYYMDGNGNIHTEH